MYLLLLSLFCVIVSSYFIMRLFFHNERYSFLVIVSFFLYVIPTLLGIGQIISVPAVVISSGILFAGSLAVFIKMRRDSRKTGSLTFSRVVLVGISSIILVGLFFKDVIKIWNYMPHGLDIVCYHFPNIIDVIQSGSLWTMQGPFSHYPMGYEMYQLWGLLFLRNDSLCGVIHWYFVILYLVFSFLILKKLLNKITVLSYFVLAVLFSIILKPLLVFSNIGKSDVAISTFALMSLYYLLDYVKSKGSVKKLVLLTVSLILMVSIKPTGILYALIFFMLLFGYMMYKRKKVSLSIIQVISMGVMLMLFAGIWYIKILLSRDAMPTNGLERSIVMNLLSPQLYKIEINFLFFLSVALFSMVLMGIILYLIKVKKVHISLLLCSIMLCVAVMIFMITPFGAFPTFPYQNIQLRLAVVMVPLFLIMVTACCMLVLDFAVTRELFMVHKIAGPIMRHADRFVQKIPGVSTRINGIMMSGIIIMVIFVGMFVLSARYRHPISLPGYDAGTGVYHWVYTNIHDQKIYSLGARPYGLYGREFSNQVFYDLHSTTSTIDRWLAVIKQENPEYFLIMKEGHEDLDNVFPRDTKKVRTMNDYFSLVYQDEQALLYRVLPEIAAILPGESGKKIRGGP